LSSIYYLDFDKPLKEVRGKKKKGEMNHDCLQPLTNIALLYPMISSLV
jgi:hypothetical protein